LMRLGLPTYWFPHYFPVTRQAKSDSQLKLDQIEGSTKRGF
jgi:hypothetical protein